MKEKDKARKIHPVNKKRSSLSFIEVVKLDKLETLDFPVV